MFKIIDNQGVLTITDGVKTYGPYDSYGDMEHDVEKHDIDIMHEPKDLVFDVGVEDEEHQEYFIMLASKANPGHDNLGSHNITGLPYGLVNEDMECTWVLEGVPMEQIKKDMVALGFTYQAFL